MAMLDLFYKIINRGYTLIFGNNYMLHAPLFLHNDETLLDAQRNFSDYCISFLPPLANKTILDVGCGNGMLALHIAAKYQPAFIYGVDIVHAQIGIAKRNAPGRESRVRFEADNAQQLSSVPDNSFDVVICFESALHYPDKELFLSQVKRVLAPGGYFLIADLLKTNHRSPGIVQRNLHLFNWSHEQYATAFNKYNFELITDKDLNDFLLPHFDGAFKKIAGEIRKKKPFTSSFFLLLMRPFYSAYVFQLRNSFRYHLFTGKIIDR
jgi:ubiquinone/menaquinone biosynthesis C-methylase UbiE